MVDYAAARLNMVEGQIKPNKVIDQALIDAMMAVPRERFVPADRRGVAYVDEDVAVGGGRVLMEPRVLGRLLNDARITPGSRVLIVGAGTGYSAALVSRLAAKVVALEEDKALQAAARGALSELGAQRVTLAEGRLTEGWAAEGPYDVILVDGAVAEVPAALLAQLAPGGRLLTVVDDGDGVGRAMLVSAVDGVVSQRPLFDAATAMLPGFERKPAFQF
ncbi:protein-L-isoaspartate O-methyltransferase family protein [Inquilinus limosus]|uniref:Protein-L-isoaspartate O-methyltransferase n=1 Tax=Inquilinus limosus TaxID=171674 RepID=A0A211ZG63_9PROT|nr:protein-L-isoaspartate O-methyltransferase [Inquilinus limosus]OWJ64272.1 protein-L-isoaspartate O-methyltransferase [Inquilinus limosus]